MAKAQNKYKFTIDGALYSSADKIMHGSQIREAGSKVPSSDFVMIQVIGKSGRSIGLQDDVTLVAGETAVFVSFKSDRIFALTVNELGWEWGADTISAVDIYRYANIDVDDELIVESDGDRIIPADGVLKLGGHGVERVRSRQANTIIIKVNGRPREVEKRHHTYREIAAIAYPNPDFSNFIYTTTYLRGVNGAEGDLVEGETIMVKKGMVFNVRRSDKS
jgi:hypothetical protein